MGDSLEKERDDNAVMNFAFRSKTLHMTEKFVIGLRLPETFCSYHEELFQTNQIQITDETVHTKRCRSTKGCQGPHG